MSLLAYWWALALTLSCAAAAYASKRSNDATGWGWSAAIVGIGFTGLLLWTVVARYSRNLIFDSLLFDIIQTLVYVGVLALLGSGARFSAAQWAGVFLVVAGFVLMKAAP